MSWITKAIFIVLLAFCGSAFAQIPSVTLAVQCGVEGPVYLGIVSLDPTLLDWAAMTAYSNGYYQFSPNTNEAMGSLEFYDVEYNLSPQNDFNVYSMTPVPTSWSQDMSYGGQAGNFYLYVVATSTTGTVLNMTVQISSGQILSVAWQAVNGTSSCVGSPAASNSVTLKRP